MLEDAEADIPALYAFPADHWRNLRSTNSRIEVFAQALFLRPVVR